MTNDELTALKTLVQYGEWPVFERYLQELIDTVQSTKQIDTSASPEAVAAQVVGRNLVADIFDTVVATAGVLKKQSSKKTDTDKYE